MRRAIAALILGLSVTSPVRAQPAATAPASEPAVRRWLDVQTLTVYARYRFTENNKDLVTTNQLQYKDSLRARFNLDAKKRYTINLGSLSGNSFTGSWNNLGVGNETTFDRKDQYLRQLYASAMPVKSLELQYGGLYIDRGESDEWVTYDDDGYVLGERVSIRRPGAFYLDELTVTRGVIGPAAVPSLLSRRNLIDHPNYTQVLGAKRFSPILAGSLEYDRQIGADILRMALTLHLNGRAPVSTIRYEQYRRFNDDAAAGFGVWADRPLLGAARIQAGYVTVDQKYGGWNADRMQSGRRVFANTTIPIHGPVSASIYATQALKAPYAVSIDRRVDVVISYDLLSSLRAARVF